MKLRSLGSLITACLLVACGGGGSPGGNGGGSGGNNNATPVIAAQSFNGTEETMLSGQVVASDAGDTLSFAAATNPAHGTLMITAAGAFTYTPAANFSGADTFSARVTDSVNQSATATMTLNVANLNDAPAAADDVLTVTSASALTVLANDVDPDGEALTVTITEAPFAGTATVNAANTVNLALPAGFKGFDKFKYRVTDAAGLQSEATALVFVNIPPFKIVSLTPASASTGSGGVFVNDLLTTRLAHEPDYAAATMDSTKLSVAPGAIAFQTVGASGPELRYIDASNLGHSRLVQSVGANQTIGYQAMSASGRFIVYEFKNADVDPGQQQLNVFDRDLATTGVRLNAPDAVQPLARLGSFNASGDSYYYFGIDAVALPWTTTIYRADLATRVSTPVSVPSPTQTPAFIWPSSDESRYVDIRFNNGGGMGAYVTTRANPAGAQLLHDPLPNPNVYFPAEASADGNYFLFTETTQSFGLAALRVSRPSSPGSSRIVGGPTAEWLLTDHKGMRADSQAMLVYKYVNIGGYAIYEAQLAAPETLTTVYFAGDIYITSPTYSLDGDRITYYTQNLASHRTVNVTRRGAFGQTVPLTPANQEVGMFSMDPTGQVAIYSVNPIPDDFSAPAMLYAVNVDAPQKILPLGPGARELSMLRIVGR